MFQYNSDGSKIHNSHSYTTEVASLKFQGIQSWCNFDGECFG